MFFGGCVVLVNCLLEVSYRIWREWVFCIQKRVCCLCVFFGVIGYRLFCDGVQMGGEEGVVVSRTGNS